MGQLKFEGDRNMRTNRPTEISDTLENQEHLAIGIPPIDKPAVVFIPDRRILMITILVSVTMIGFWLILADRVVRPQTTGNLSAILSSKYFWLSVAVGLAAQIVDGALGMAYGITSNTFLLSIGASPAAASGAVHVAEIFTTAISGAAHVRFGNVDRELFRKIVVPGVISGVCGVLFLTSIDGRILKPFVTFYLLIMGLIILRKAFVSRAQKKSAELVHVRKLAAAGGFLDAVGGGGWGPVVTSSLIGQGHDPRKTIGTVNTAEFFVAIATGTGFLLLGGIDHWILVGGLIIGGLFAAPVSAYLTSRLPARTLLVLVGLLISLLSIFNIYKALGS